MRLITTEEYQEYSKTTNNEERNSILQRLMDKYAGSARETAEEPTEPTPPQE
jgi:hypothetical protein